MEYSKEKITVSSKDGKEIPAYVLIPNKAKKAPAIVMLHDHGARFDIGKEKLVKPLDSEADYIKTSSKQWIDKYFDGVYLADSLASLGYVVLVSDAIYWGEQSSAKTQLWSKLSYSDYDSTLVGKERKDSIKVLKNEIYENQTSVYDSLYLDGKIWAQEILSEDIACVNYVKNLPCVDPSRIGCFGFSMGAHRSWLLAAFCKNIKAGVASSWMMMKEDYDGNNASDLSMRIASLRDKKDFPEIVLDIVPRHFMFLSGKEDHLFPTESVQRAFDRMHELTNESPAIETGFFDGEHHCGKEVQGRIVEFFSNNL